MKKIIFLLLLGIALDRGAMTIGMWQINKIVYNCEVGPVAPEAERYGCYETNAWKVSKVLTYIPDWWY